MSVFYPSGSLECSKRLRACGVHETTYLCFSNNKIIQGTYNFENPLERKPPVVLEHAGADARYGRGKGNPRCQESGDGSTLSHCN